MAPETSDTVATASSTKLRLARDDVGSPSPTFTDQSSAPGVLLRLARSAEPEWLDLTTSAAPQGSASLWLGEKDRQRRTGFGRSAGDIADASCSDAKRSGLAHDPSPSVHEQFGHGRQPSIFSNRTAAASWTAGEALEGSPLSWSPRQVVSANWYAP